jgi:hypothetical protein
MEQPVARPVEKPRDNVWHARTLDGQDRSHIPPMAKRLFFVRIAQLVLAVAYLVLAAFAAFTLNASTVSLLNPDINATSYGAYTAMMAAPWIW